MIFLSFGKSKSFQMWNYKNKFLTWLIRKFRLKKNIEIGITSGRNSIFILNDIKYKKNANLYSIAQWDNNKIGFYVKELYPNCESLYKGNTVAKNIENIGKNIDMEFIEFIHFTWINNRFFNCFTFYERSYNNWF